MLYVLYSLPGIPGGLFLFVLHSVFWNDYERLELVGLKYSSLVIQTQTIHHIWTNNLYE